MCNYFRLSKTAVEDLAERYGTPLLVLSLEQIERNYRLLADHLPGVKLHYAVKANPDERIVRRLAELGSCFDLASDGEMRALSAMGIEPERLVYANPVKTASGLSVAQQTGVYKFTFDSAGEVAKMAAAVPGGTVLLRIRMDNVKALVNLNEKFGAQPSEAIDLLRQARDAGLDAAGLCFHVGSQSVGAEAYLEALRVCRRLFDEAAAAGIPLRMLDIGGGFPIPTRVEAIDVVPMADAIQQELNRSFAGVEVWAEPGRFICGTAANLITRVIGEKIRSGQQWYFLDDGLYGTFSGVIFDHWDFELETFRQDKTIRATFAGPSCDSLDVLFRDRSTPPLAVNDLILVPACGAYTSASATVFNGFAKTSIVIWEEVRTELGDGAGLATAG
ncbi:MAG TPA: type III PLP-dependent enzyme [Patescibacteria group bacterium]|nr:type III PLP-dependent enzyme [Patescibacteria group bacterium]